MTTDEELARHLRATPATAGPYPVVAIEPEPVDHLLNQLLLWTLSSPHATVPIPVEPVRTRTGRGVPDWAGRMTSGVEERKG